MNNLTRAIGNLPLFEITGVAATFGFIALSVTGVLIPELGLLLALLSSVVTTIHAYVTIDVGRGSEPADEEVSGGVPTTDPVDDRRPGEDVVTQPYPPGEAPAPEEKIDIESGIGGGEEPTEPIVLPEDTPHRKILVDNGIEYIIGITEMEEGLEREGAASRLEELEQIGEVRAQNIRDWYYAPTK